MIRFRTALAGACLQLSLAAQASTFAGTTPGTTDVDPFESSVSNALAEGLLQAHARVDDIGRIGASSAANLRDSFFGQRNAFSQASYSQQYRVTAPGLAMINWYVQGSLQSTVTDAKAVYQLQYGFHVESDAFFLGGIATESRALMDPGEIVIDRSGGAAHEFFDYDVGKTFTVTATLNTSLMSSNFVVTGAVPSVELEADFLDSAGIASVSGGIAPVPEPATWAMLASGLGFIGIGAVRGRRAMAASP